MCLDRLSRRTLPPIREEYRNVFPCDVNHHIYIECGVVSIFNQVVENLSILAGDDTATGNLLKRWQEVSPNLYDFLRDAQPGDIFLKKQYRPYNPRAPQQFRNTPNEHMFPLVNGKTHVDIGFVDFGIVFDSIGSLSFDGDPLTVVGYDAEPFCVAKSLVMLEIINDPTTTPRNVLEVWLSSLWSKATLRAFKKATKSLTNIGQVAIDPRVRSILKFWESSLKISRKSALEIQIQGVAAKRDTKWALRCCSLKSKKDRVSFLRYVFTNALYEDDTTVCGSIVMCQSDEAIGVKQIFESCLESIPSPVWIRASDSVLDTARSYFEGNMEKLVRHVRQGTIIFTPKLGTVSLRNSSLIQEIAAMHPYTISWSNVVDYIHPTDFHRVAKRVSGPDTVHVLHSCNWCTRVHGTDIFDINPAVRLSIYAEGLFFAEQCHAGAVDHFRNQCASILGRIYVKKFLRYFFKGEDVRCACMNGKSPLTPWSPFARNTDTAHYIFAYAETGISFGQDACDFLSEDYE